jgi:trans-aconitate 2-methyltransferase
MGNEKANSDRWDPDQYAKFAAERAKPGFDLIAMVAEIPGGDAVDLGCGSGELTARLHDHSRARATLGLDSSEAMLAKARPLSGKGLQFEIGDINDFAAEHDFDVVFANASLHWVPDHPQLLRRLTAALRPQGQLAVQVPANGDHPSHALADEVARQDRFAKYLREAPSPGATAVCAPERYSELLHELGFSTQNVRLQVYGHELASTGEVVEWTRGTTLLRFEKVLPADIFDEFVDCYRKRLLAVLGNQTPYFYTFKRILFWGRLG